MAAKFFNLFPKMTFNDMSLVDITRHIVFQDIVKKYAVFFEKITIQDGQKPEDIAYDYYQDAGYHWIVLLANDMINPYYDWPLISNNLSKLVNDKYEDPNGVHHYETNRLSPLPIGTIVDESYSSGERDAITNFEYEDRLNESKRSIILVKKDFLPRILDEFDRKIVL